MSARVTRSLGGLILIGAVVFAAGCNTVEGFGKDLSTLGGKISNKADQEQND